MKPITAQDYAKCYGTLIANINASKLPKLTAWFGATFPDIALMAKLNSAVFNAYPATLSAFPKPGATRNLGRFGGLVWENQAAKAQGMLYNNTIEPYWNTLTMNLSSAMYSAEFDLTTAAKNIAALKKIKPKPQTKIGK
jgi:hypothetical protein